ncbi:MAG: bifunctional diaminohydroxyphosphoribosylaminopyrimidine deaminase/5-amino-6-(5-phosphoribosylamino)uracil reductase RibD [Armatimonadota bacterium]
MDDIILMEEALALARRAAGRTSPNPLVGAVIVADGQIVGRGFHAQAGEAHAEVLALRDAGARARAGTLYVTLEPCNHLGRRGPCTEAVIGAGIRRVVVAMVDPDTQVNGRGIDRLRNAGIDVEVGVLEARARRLNEFFIKHRTTGLPFVTLKWAMSLDGKIATRRGSATAITDEEARRYAHGLRNLYDAVLVGAGTVLADDPQLTCRLAEIDGTPGRNPLRVVVDSRLRTPPAAHVATGVAEAPTLIVTTEAALPERIDAMRGAGVEVFIQELREGPVDLRAVMQELGRRGVLSVLVEGGGTVNASLLSAGLVDKVIALIAPRLIGGAQAPTPVDGSGVIASANGAKGAARGLRLCDVRVHALGNDVAIEGYTVA